MIVTWPIARTIGERPECRDLGDVVQVTGTFAAGGVVLLRGAIGRVPLARIRDAARSALAADPDRYAVRLDELRLDAETRQSLAPPLFFAIASRYLSSPAEVAAESHVRSMSPLAADAIPPFHRTESVLTRKVLTGWIPLAPCGGDGLRLEIVPGSWVLEVSAGGGAAETLEAGTIVDRFGRSALWRPSLELGDAMLFSGRTAHRAYAIGETPNRAVAIELSLI